MAVQIQGCSRLSDLDVPVPALEAVILLRDRGAPVGSSRVRTRSKICSTTVADAMMFSDELLLNSLSRLTIGVAHYHRDGQTGTAVRRRPRGGNPESVAVTPCM